MKKAFKQKALAAVLTIAALAVGQTVMAETVTYTLSGNTEQTGNANLDITAEGSATGTARTSWSYTNGTSASVSLPGGITLSFGTDKESQGMAAMGALVINVNDNTSTGYITLSHDSKYIYHVTMNGTPTHEAWNLDKSYTYSFQGETVVYSIEVVYADEIPITDAVIKGISSSYPVSNAAIEPVPSAVTWHGKQLDKQFSYTLSYQNNDIAGQRPCGSTRRQGRVLEDQKLHQRLLLCQRK